MTRGRAFGLDVDAEFPVPELPPAGLARPHGPRTTLEAASAGELRRAWPARGAETLLERVWPDGRPMMVVERHADAGFHVWAPRYGRHLVSPDGVRVRCALPRVSSWRWERLLFAQVLPLASALLGRALFHASAVALDGGAYAFVGLSGTGKSSAAAHLVARGATLLTDDVLALERTNGELRAHPGTRLAGVDPRELRAMGASGRARLGTRIGKSDKAYLAVPVADEPVPLRALYFLTRGPGAEVAIEPSPSLAPRLLGSSFIAYLDGERHLVEHLEVCAQIAADVACFELSAPASGTASAVAAAVFDHARAGVASRPLAIAT
jgi:hypothetical protein